MFSIIIPSLHSPMIDQVVAALQRQTAHDAIREIIVVGQDRYGNVPPDVRFLATPQPISPAAARNLGASAAQAEYLLFVDSDCIAAPDLVARLREAHQRGYPVVGGSVTIEPGAYWRLCDNLLGFAGYLRTDSAGPRAYLPSLNLSLRRDLFLATGGFDPRFAPVGEDVELSMRLRSAGYSLQFEPQATLFHRPERLTPGSVWRHLQSYGRGTPRVRYGDERLAPRANARLRPFGGLIRAAAPLLAFGDTVRMLARRAELRRYWYTLPGLLWGRIAWYWGVVDGLLAAPQTSL